MIVKSFLASMMLGAVILSPAGASGALYSETSEPLTPGDTYPTVVQVGEVPESSVYPMSITAQQIGNTPYITKIYEVDSATNVESLVAEFQQDGYQFSRYDILVKPLAGTTETKLVSKTIVAAAESDEKEKLLASVEPIIDYSEGGFAGQLQLDADQISFAETGRTSYGYTLRETQQYTGLDRNDAAYIAKTMQKNGVTLQLESVDWQIMGTTPVDGSLVPNLYNAVATYSGRATGSKASGYTATLVYSGEVSREIPGWNRVSVIYRGEPITQTKSESHLPLIIGSTLLFLLAAGASVGVVLMVKRKKHTQTNCSNAEGDDDNWEEGLEEQGYLPMEYREGEAP
jgi:hypothetical protein